MCVCVCVCVCVCGARTRAVFACLLRVHAKPPVPTMADRHMPTYRPTTSARSHVVDMSRPPSLRPTHRHTQLAHAQTNLTPGLSVEDALLRRSRPLPPPAASIAACPGPAGGSPCGGGDEFTCSPSELAPNGMGGMGTSCCGGAGGTPPPRPGDEPRAIALDATAAAAAPAAAAEAKPPFAAMSEARGGEAAGGGCEGGCGMRPECRSVPPPPPLGRQGLLPRSWACV